MYDLLAHVHLVTVLPATAIGGVLLLRRRKGDRPHRLAGRVFMALLVVTAAVTLFMPARVGPAWLGHFGFLHLLVPLVLGSVWGALRAVRAGDVDRHQRIMVSLYVSALLVPGTLSLLPGRFLHQAMVSLLP